MHHGSAPSRKLEHLFLKWEEPGGRGDVIQSAFLHCSWVGGVLSMINYSDSSRRKDVENAGEAGLEEARLRQQAIGVKLRHMFDEVVNEPVPDEFLEILKRADAKASGGGA
ncbi:hypothetical protein GGR11_001902 [Brevundimonas mediterranea]|jgi:hypothetical protein|uniref:Anti-sigma factor NepR domain-containing protein n=2 Tax=Caulobacteraceae TaxID=76892 RepID=A0A7W6EZY6_9CAUL|nr:hypothetical protein [Brevundimonas mediterranea]